MTHTFKISDFKTLKLKASNPVSHAYRVYDVYAAIDISPELYREVFDAPEVCEPLFIMVDAKTDTLEILVHSWEVKACDEGVSVALKGRVNQVIPAVNE